MSAMDNHQKRSSRGNRVKRGAFGNMARRTCIRPTRFGNKTLGMRDLFALFRGRNHSRRSKVTYTPTEASGED